MPAMMLPFAERSASGHRPGGWGVFGALIIEGAGGLLALEEKPGSTTGESRLAEWKEGYAEFNEEVWCAQ